ncbi:MAG: BatA domain-containing protein, partial [Planctomycetaceae bacterium]|nr:BatA domain-containing protein [Planctomycetaceae bacterium]
PPRGRVTGIHKSGAMGAEPVGKNLKDRRSNRMSLINSSLLIGLVLAGLPILLHMVMRAKPKKIEFPALRLLKARQASNSRRMQLRQFLLLLLRILTIVLLVLAVARPSLPAASYGLTWWEWLVLILSVVGSFAAYFLWNRQARPAGNSEAGRQQRARRRTWCVAGGTLIALLLVVLPWGLRIRRELASPHSDAMENIPVAAVFVFDTSASMNYRHDSQTRLETAQTLAVEHIGRLPDGSRAAIAGLSRDEEVIFQADLPGARSLLEGLQTTAVPDSLNRAIRRAIQTQLADRERVQKDGGIGEENDLFVREIYVLTDLSESAWDVPDGSGLRDLLVEHEWLRVYLIDVSVENPVNLSLTGLRLSDETAINGRSVEVVATVSGTAATSPNASLELILVDPQGRETRVGASRPVELRTSSTEVAVELPIRSSERYVEGLIRLTDVDPLLDDNVQYFSLGVSASLRVLLVADKSLQARQVREALQPEDARQTGQATLCTCTTISTAQLSQTSLSAYDAVCLVNCARPDPVIWSNLSEYVRDGGGLFVVAGSDAISPGAWGTAEAVELLPAVPIGPVRYLVEPAHLKPAPTSSAIVDAFQQDPAILAELNYVNFMRCTAVEAPADDARVLMTFEGPADRPALLERRVGNGRVVMFTSAMDNLPGGGSDWNDLVVSWSVLVMLDEVMQSLTGFAEQSHNYTVGEPIELPVPAAERFAEFRLRRPGLRQTAGQLPAAESSILITDADAPGHYLLKPFESPSPWQAAFSANLPDEETMLMRILPEKLDRILGEDRVVIVRSLAELDRMVQIGRLGIEVFPLCMAALIILYCAEHLMANYFYDEERQPQSSAVGSSIP